MEKNAVLPGEQVKVWGTQKCPCAIWKQLPERFLRRTSFRFKKNEQKNSLKNPKRTGA